MLIVYLQVHHLQLVVSKNNDDIIIRRFVSLVRLLFPFFYRYYHRKKKEYWWGYGIISYIATKTIDGQQPRLICAIFIHDVVVFFSKNQKKIYIYIYIYASEYLVWYQLLVVLIKVDNRNRRTYFIIYIYKYLCRTNFFTNRYCLKWLMLN